MRRIGLALALTALVLLTAWHSTAFEPPTIPLTVRVSPEYSDRRFPYITYHKVWQGTPAERDDVADRVNGSDPFNEFVGDFIDQRFRYGKYAAEEFCFDDRFGFSHVCSSLLRCRP